MPFHVLDCATLFNLTVDLHTVAAEPPGQGPPLFEVPGPPMQFDPPLLTQSKRAQDCENAVHRHKVKVY